MFEDTDEKTNSVASERVIWSVMPTDFWGHGQEDQEVWYSDEKYADAIFWGALGKKIAHKSRNSCRLSGGGVDAEGLVTNSWTEFQKITKDKRLSIFLVVIFIVLILGLCSMGVSEFCCQHDCLIRVGLTRISSQLPVSDLSEWHHICHFFWWQKMWQVTFVTFLGRMWRSHTRKYFFNLWRFLSHPSRPPSLFFGPAGTKLFWTGRNVTIQLGLKNVFLFPSKKKFFSSRFVTYLGSVKREGHFRIWAKSEP